MLDRALADIVLAAHFAFLVFVVAGGLLARRHRWIAIPHLVAASWGVYVEVADAPCPLTRLENRYARQAGRAGYEESFIEHYLMPVVYPAGLTRSMQWGMAGFVVGANVLAYAWPRRAPTVTPNPGGLRTKE